MDSPRRQAPWLVGSCLCALAVLLTVLPTPSVGPVSMPLVLLPLLLLIRLLPMTLAVPWVLGTSAVLWFLLGQTPIVWFVLLQLLLLADVVAAQFVRRDNLLLMDLTAALALSVGALLLIHFQAFEQFAVVPGDVQVFALGGMVSIAFAETIYVSPATRYLRAQVHHGPEIARPALLHILEVAVFSAVLATLCVNLIVLGDQAPDMLLPAGLALACVMVTSTRLLTANYAAPLRELVQSFDRWRQLNAQDGGGGTLLQTLSNDNLSSVEDIYALQVGFSSLAKTIVRGERRLSTIAANYDELLRSLPLGVMAIDADSRVQFLNDALGEITDHRQDALISLQKKGSDMLEHQQLVDEWQLRMEDAPPKSLLLVVTHRLDESGQGSGFWTIVTDITEQRNTNAQLVQAAKLATLGEMSTGMAHELNQPLNVISLAASNLRFSLEQAASPGSENRLAKLDRIDSAVRRAAGIIDHMRAYGRLSGEGLSPIELGAVVAGASDLMSEQLKLANITLINQFPDGDFKVMGNSIQLEQVLINLINNAKDAISDTGGPGEIIVDAETIQQRILLRVSDTGGGIPEHALPHIFEPFFTTKPVGEGTGLGGSISYGIIRDMQGDIWAENLPQGARITVSLPLLQSKSQIAKSGQLDMDGLDL